MAENQIGKKQRVLNKLFKRNTGVDISNHFTIRLCQRFDVVQRRHIIRDIYVLLKSGAALVGETEKRIKVVLNDATLCVAMNSDTLMLTTVYPTKRSVTC